MEMYTAFQCLDKIILWFPNISCFSLYDVIDPSDKEVFHGGLWASWVHGVFQAVCGSMLYRLNNELGTHMCCSFSDLWFSHVTNTNSGCHCVTKHFISYHINSTTDFTSTRSINLQNHIKD